MVYTLNVSDLLSGYNSKRFFNLIPYAGVNIIFIRNKSRDDEMSLNAGLLNTFRFCSNLDFNLDVCALMFDDLFNGSVLGKKNDGMLFVSSELTYKLGSKSRIGWARDHFIVVLYREVQKADLLSNIDFFFDSDAYS